MQKTIILLTTFCCFWLKTFGQDTIYFKNKVKFHQIIKYGFMDSYWFMPESLFSRIDSVFHSIDFNKLQIPCQNRFCFFVDLDSCGVIKESKPLKNDIYAPEMSLFEQEVNKLILNSGWQIDNIAKMTDTTFIFNSLLIYVETSCDPDEIIVAPKEWSRDMIRILAYRNEEELIIFDYFTNNCIKK